MVSHGDLSYAPHRRQFETAVGEIRGAMGERESGKRGRGKKREERMDAQHTTKKIKSKLSIKKCFKF